MVSVSPRMRDSLDFDEAESIDPRLSFGFQSMSLESGDEELCHTDDYRPRSRASDPSTRKKKRQRHIKTLFGDLADREFEYETVADGDVFRLIELAPGIGSEAVSCRLMYESYKKPEHEYICLSYCWSTTARDAVRDAAIICNDRRFRVTSNLLSALRSLRNRTAALFIWVDQICINQDDVEERGHQVSIMKHIFNQAKEVCVWLGEQDDKERMHKLFEYAKRLRRGEDSPRNQNNLDRILSPRQLQLAIQRLLERPWFQRVWVIPEVALARFTFVACGRSRISWDNLVRLIRETKTPNAAVFDKQEDLLGNPRQRIAIITQMIASQREGLAHTDITQLLIVAKSSRATDVRDMIYAFYGLTLLTTFPNYTRSVEVLYPEIVLMYVNSIKWEMSYSTWHNLTEQQRTFQLMSILYSAGALHQHIPLPSWIPDFTFSWHLAPIWCKTTSNIVTGSGKDEWSMGVRSDFRAGGDQRETFEIIEGWLGKHQLRLSVIIFDSIIVVSENTPASTPGASEQGLAPADIIESPILRYGRTYFHTGKGYIGIATPGVEAGDNVAVILGGDVPVVLRPCENHDDHSRAYKLLCECFVQNEATMNGELVRTDWTLAEDIVLI